MPALVSVTYSTDSITIITEVNSYLLFRQIFVANFAL